MSLLQRIFGETRQRAALAPLYRAVVAEGRDPFWYREGKVPDTMDGRFDMIAAVLALVLIRLEAEGEAGRANATLLTELFVDDMDATFRQLGIGDHLVGKHVGRMMGALGGRLAAFRAARAGEGDFAAAVRRNVFHEAPPSDEAVALVAAGSKRSAARLDALPVASAAGRAAGMTAPEFSRPVRIDTLGARPRRSRRGRRGRAGGAGQAFRPRRDRAADRRGVADPEGRRGDGRRHASSARSRKAASRPGSRSRRMSRRLSSWSSARSPKPPAHDEEIELAEAELDTIFYEGGAIDVGEAVAETLAAQPRSLSARAGRRGDAQGRRREERGGSRAVRGVWPASGTSSKK